jgi:hypothetical protein
MRMVGGERRKRQKFAYGDTRQFLLARDSGVLFRPRPRGSGPEPSGNPARHSAGRNGGRVPFASIIVQNPELRRFFDS